LLLNWATAGDGLAARELLAEPELELWIAKVASALERKGSLTGAEVEALRPDRLTVELQEAA